MTFLGFGADWWTVFATALAALIALVALIFAFRSARDERKRVNVLDERERARDEADRRRQAAAVYCDGIPSYLPARPGDDLYEEARAASLSVTVHNASDRPIYNVIVQFRKVGHSLTDGVLDTQPIWNAVSPTQATIGPGASLPFRSDLLPEPLYPPADQRFEAWVTFRDAAGVQWKLISHGHLEERR